MTYSEKGNTRNDASVLGAGEHVVCFAGVASLAGRAGAQAAVGNLLASLWWHRCGVRGFGRGGFRRMSLLMW